MTNTFNVSIIEQITIAGVQQTFKTESAITDLQYYDRRTMSIPADNPVDVIKLNTLIANGTFILSDVSYLRITNLDSSFDIRLRVLVSLNDTYDVDVKPGQSFLLSSLLMNTSDSEVVFSGFQNPDTIQAQALVTSPPIGFTGINIEYLLVSM